MNIETRLKVLEATAKKVQIEMLECLSDEQLLEIILRHPWISGHRLRSADRCATRTHAAGEDPAKVVFLQAAG